MYPSRKKMSLIGHESSLTENIRTKFRLHFSQIRKYLVIIYVKELQEIFVDSKKNVCKKNNVGWKIPNLFKKY